MIDFSTVGSWAPEGDVGRHQRDCGPDGERPEIVAPGPVIWTFASVALTLARVHAIPQHDYLHGTHGNALKWA